MYVSTQINFQLDKSNKTDILLKSKIQPFSMQSDLTQNYKNLIIHNIYTHKRFISNLSQSLPEDYKFDGKNTIDSLEI